MSFSTAEARPAAETLDFLDAGGGDVAARSPLQLFWRRFRKDRVAMVSGGVVIGLILIALGSPLVVGVLGLRVASHFGGPPFDYATHRYPGDAATALAQLDSAYAGWGGEGRGEGGGVPEEIRESLISGRFDP